MSTSRLRIDTNVQRGITLASQQRPSGPSDTLSQTLQSQNRARARSGSLASTSSSLSVESPAPSSASSSSGHIPHTVQEPEDTQVTASNPTSPSADETMRIQPAASEFVLALHDFIPQQQNATCLSFRAGQVVRVLNKDPSGWWDGELDGQRGWFPSNYVSADEGVISLAEDLPSPYSTKMRHGHTISSLSAASWATTPSRGSSRKDHRPLVTEALGSDITSYCPPLMPATACIISSVRSILSVMECLHRDAPLLKQFTPLAAERKHILSGLAALVSQAKKASDESYDEDIRDAEIEGMLKLGGQVFSQVRRFVAVAVQCGIELPEKAQVSQCDSATALAVDGSPVETSEPLSTPPRFATPPKPSSQQDGDNLLKFAMRTKSLSDLRSQRRLATYRESDSSVVPLLSYRTARSRLKREQYQPHDRTNSYHKPGMSISSTSSSSSFSSTESPKSVLTPHFPTGPTTSAEIMEALKHTHDAYLSAVSAFIGHAFSHSRSSHASSTGHMYDLVREIMEMACRLLTIVEVVIRHPGIPPHKVNNLKLAKEGLYNVTTSLAESVRQLTMPLPPDVTDDAERDSLVRCATEAHRAGANCFSAVKTCLSRTPSQQQFIIELPTMSHSDPAPCILRKFPSHPEAVSARSNSCNGPVDEDVTIHPPTRSIHPPQLLSQTEETSSDCSDATTVSKSFDGSQDTALTSPDEQSSEAGSGTNLDVLANTASSSSAQLADDVDAFLRRTPDTLVDDVAGDDASLITLEVKRKPLGRDPDAIYNSDGHLVAASLDVLVEKMTPQDSIVDAAFSAVFFLTFRLFCSPIELVQAIIDRYNVVPPPNMSKEDALTWERYKEMPVRLRVSNFVKTWLELYWRSGVDDPALPHLATFISEALQPYFPGPCQRILALIDIRKDANSDVISPKSERARDPGMSINPPSFSPSEIPRPTMTKTLLASLRSKHFESVSVTDFDALELARQLTIMECELYCAIQPEEILETGQEGAKPPVHVKAVSSLSTVITGWVAENILNEHDLKKRTTLVKFFIKLADRCTFLNNFSTPRSILAALDSSTISRLHTTWSGVSQKNKGQLESLRRLADHSRNYHEYRSRLRNTAPPAVPFLGLYLTDVTFCREGNPSYRDGPSGKKLLNFNKYHKLARIVQDMQRFQVPYNLKQIPEVQQYLNVAFENSKHHGDLEDLYRRSLLVEPKQPADTPPTSDMRHLFNWATRSQAQQPTSA
ncbi:cell division control protein 25 [Pisolithus marmoratus]|nr:cell division control protein 25 [Pisolithus marmoratus]